MCWDKPSPTITTQFYGYGNGRFGHPEQNRALSMREDALIQSFPPDYIFYDCESVFSRKEVGIHIGNAVPIKLGRAIGIKIANHLREVDVRYVMRSLEGGLFQEPLLILLKSVVKTHSL